MRRLRIQVAPFTFDGDVDQLKEELRVFLMARGTFEADRLVVKNLWEVRGEGIQDNALELILDKGEMGIGRIKTALPQFTPEQIENAMKRLSKKGLVSSYVSSNTGRPSWKYYLNPEQRSEVFHKRNAVANAKSNAVRIWQTLKAAGIKKGEEVPVDILDSVGLSLEELRFALRALTGKGHVTVAYYSHDREDVEHRYHVFVGSDPSPEALERQAAERASGDEARAKRATRRTGDGPLVGLIKASEAQEMTTRGLSEARGISRSAIHKQLARLEERGIITSRMLPDGSKAWKVRE